MDTLSQHGNITLNIIVNGDLNLPNEVNLVIFEAVQSYIQRKLMGYTRISRYLYQTKRTLNSDSDSEHTSMISVGPLLHHSQSPVTSYCIHSLRKYLLHSSSFLPPSLFFFVSSCVICFSFLFLFSIYVCSSLHVKLHNYYLLINCYYLKRTIGN